MQIQIIIGVGSLLLSVTLRIPGKRTPSPHHHRLADVCTYAGISNDSVMKHRES